MPALLTLFLLLIFIPSSSPASTPEEEYQKIQEKMLEQKKKLAETQQRESSILGELDEANLKLGKVETELKKYRQKLRELEREITEVSTDITITKHRLEKQKDWVRRKLRTMQKFGSSGDLATLLLNSDDISGMMRAWKYLEQMTIHEHKRISEYRETLTKLDEKNRKLEDLKASLSSQAHKIRGKEAELTEKKKEKERILTSVRNEKASHRKMIEELKEASKKLQDLIRESSKKDTYTATGFSRLKGKLVWPAEGKIVVRYGAQKDIQFDTPVFRNGVHIQTNENSDARAVYGGKVIFAEWFKGFGQLVIVNHGSGYHTLYGNLSEIFSHVGDIIKDNQVIGRVGTSGVLNAPGLYFEIRFKGKPLDPTQWLRQRKR